MISTWLQAGYQFTTKCVRHGMSMSIGFQHESSLIPTCSLQDLCLHSAEAFPLTATQFLLRECYLNPLDKPEHILKCLAMPPHGKKVRCAKIKTECLFNTQGEKVGLETTKHHKTLHWMKAVGYSNVLNRCPAKDASTKNDVYYAVLLQSIHELQWEWRM